MKAIAGVAGLVVTATAVGAMAEDHEQAPAHAGQVEDRADIRPERSTLRGTDVNEEHGIYVADADLRALYLFTSDRQAFGGWEAVSECYGACADAWPPLIASSSPEVGWPLQSSLLGTIERRDGRLQVTYGGWPLYYHAKDEADGSITGQDMHVFGGVWYLVSPDGTKIEPHQNEQAARFRVPAVTIRLSVDDSVSLTVDE